jgi:hypothetical protein
MYPVQVKRLNHESLFGYDIDRTNRFEKKKKTFLVLLIFFKTLPSIQHHHIVIA